MDYRIEKDTMGELKVESHKKWGAQTQRSLENFKIGVEKMPLEIIYSLVRIKRSAAIINNRKGLITDEIKDSIIFACDEILSGKYDDNFPLSVWQTGSGTQTNMNVNEVISFIANEKIGEKLVHPNDHVNRSQSSNDVFPSAMHMAAYDSIRKKLIPSIDKMIEELNRLEKKYENLVKNGRTHLQDATPVTLGQEISAWKYSMVRGKEIILENLNFVKDLAMGATAVGTGLNTPENFDKDIIEEINLLTKLDYRVSKNKFHSLTSKVEISSLHGSITSLAMDLMKIANDIRWLSSGPRSGIGELIIPENEPGSSIMPGKVNPTQSEALTMVVTQIYGNDATIKFSASQGNFQLNVFMPVIIHNFLQSVRLLSDGIDSFTKNVLNGLKANEGKIKYNLDNSLMLVTSLTPIIGYDKSAEIAKYAYTNGLNLRESALKLNYLTAEEFDRYVNPDKMV